MQIALGCGQGHNYSSLSKRYMAPGNPLSPLLVLHCVDNVAVAGYQPYTECAELNECVKQYMEMANPVLLAESKSNLDFRTQLA